MITAITIENFKGISDPVRLELRPITLLFGQNSAGKSSLLHALIYAREVFERHNLDADRTLAAGDHLDLGGFRTLVRNHDLKNTIRLRFDLNLSGIDLPGGYDPALDGERVYTEFELFSSRVEKAWVAVSIAWSQSNGEPFASEYEIGINDAPFACLRCDAPGRGVRIVQLDNESGLFDFFPVDPLLDVEPYLYFQEMVNNIRPRLTPVAEAGAIGILDQYDALPDLQTQAEAFYLRVAADRTEDPRLGDAHWEPTSGDPLRTVSTLEEFERIMFRLVVGPALLVREALAGFRYIGPQRQVPPRDYNPPRLPDPGRWANGMAGCSATLPVQLVAVEHPELNLHPRLQAELADAFLEGALAEATRGRIFVIETHSEVFTLRLFRRVRESHRKKGEEGRKDGRGDSGGTGAQDRSGEGQDEDSGAGRFDAAVTPPDVAVWYVDRSSGLVTIKQILVDVEGEFVQPWPEGDSLFEQDFRERYA